MCFHSFEQTTQSKHIHFCTKCNSLHINNCLTTLKPSSFMNKTHIDPLHTFSQLLTNHYHNINFPLNNKHSSPTVNLYLQTRTLAINTIKYIATTYGLDEQLYHSSIYLCDYLYMKMNFVEDVQITAIVIVILLTKFKHDGQSAVIIERELLYKNENYLKRYKDIEMNILKTVNYDLGLLNAFDILNMLLHNGIVFEQEVLEGKCQLDKMYLNCIIQLNNFVEKKNYVNYSPIEIAFAIIIINRQLYGMKMQLNGIFNVMYNISENSYSNLLNTLMKKNKRIAIQHPSNTIVQHKQSVESQ